MTSNTDGMTSNTDVDSDDLTPNCSQVLGTDSNTDCVRALVNISISSAPTAMEEQYVRVAHEDTDVQDGIGNRELLYSFIKMYETLPELWDPSHTAYTNKNKRNAALDKLLTVYSKMKPNATQSDVRKKINTLRSNYRKELKKVVDSIRSGTGRDDIYEPSSWVFHELKFLKNSRVPVLGSMSEDMEEGTPQDFESPVERRAEYPLAISAAATNRVTQPVKKKRVQGPVIDTKPGELLSMARHYLAKSSETPDSDYLDIAKVWANKLKELEPRQKLYAEKAINDILFEAHLGSLKKDSVRINDDPNVTYAGMYLSTVYSPTPPTTELSCSNDDCQK